MANSGIDQNSRQTLTALSSVDGSTIVALWADPTLHALLTTGGIASLYTQTPVGTIDGVNAAFTTTNTINFVVGLYQNGAFVHPVDYTFASTTLTFNTAPDVSFAGMPFTIVYY